MFLSILTMESSLPQSSWLLSARSPVPCCKLSEAVLPTSQHQNPTEEQMVQRLSRIAIVLALSLSMTACNAYQTAETAYHVIEAIAGVVEADLPSLQAAGLFSPQEGQVISGYLSLVKRLNDQYGSCVANVQSAMLSTKGKYLACANVFSAGLLDPNELAQLRVISPRAQQKVQ